MTAPCVAAPLASLCSPSSTSLTKRTAAKTCGTGTHAADAPRSRLSAIRATRLTRFALLCLLLFFGWTGVGKAVVPCKTAIPCKEVWFFNNSSETMYVVLVSGARTVDEWMQAFLQVPNATARQTAVWQTLKDYRIYVNGKTGIPPYNSADPNHGFFKIRVPLFTQLLPFSQAATGTYKDSLINWWNGGRVAIYDTLGKDAITKDYDNDVTNKNLIDPTKLPSGNQFVECVAGDCGEVKMFGGVGGLPGKDPTQLTEMTFGSALTDRVIYKDIPFKWIPGDVGYNVSAVDSVYMPVAMEPLNNPLIPYIGSVKPPADIRKILTQWVTDHPGWPVFKGFPADHPRIPEAHTVFFDAFLANDTINTNSDLTAPTAGGPIDNMIKLYLGCMKATPPLTDTCQKIQTLEKTLFQPNLAIYKSFDCGKNFNASVTWQLRTLYGWVPYNFNEKGVACTGNDLALTLGTDDKARALYQQLSDSYRLDQTQQHPKPGLQYNFRTEKDSKLWFNPYVELIHGANYLNMRNYAFSIDDAVGFQSHPADGLIFAVGGTRGLQNPHELQPNEVVNVAYGGNSPWKSVGLCSKSVDTITLDPAFPSFDFYPRNIIIPSGVPCMVSALNSNGHVYQFITTATPPDDTVISCAGVTDQAWCLGINLSGDHKSHISPPAINIK